MKNNERIEEHMTEYPSLASGRTSVLEAQEFMKEMGIRHLPVVDNGKIVGVIPGGHPKSPSHGHLKFPQLAA